MTHTLGLERETKRNTILGAGKQGTPMYGSIVPFLGKIATTDEHERTRRALQRKLVHFFNLQSGFIARWARWTGG